MDFPWTTSRRAFADAAEWFVTTAALVDGRWDEPGLGEWDIRSLVGHTSRALLTVESYLQRPADQADVESTTAYYRATSAMAAVPSASPAARPRSATPGPAAMALVAR